MHARPCIPNMAGAFSWRLFSRTLKSLTLFFCSIPIEIDLWALKIKSKYAKQYLFLKRMRM